MTPSLIILQYYSTYHLQAPRAATAVGDPRGLLQCLYTNIIQVGCVLVVPVSELGISITGAQCTNYTL